jgi:hypothetical protein
MTTFTTEDRIHAEKDGSLTVNVNAGEVAVTLKDLTDDEIRNIWSKIVCSVHMTKAELEFARAILKKAQEQ